MLSREENELMTRVGPGTLMGKLFRQYWLPMALSSELPESDGDPLRVMLLGEPLIAFRDSKGAVGLIQTHCPHRGASLFFGRNEESGIRCVYHGWKFDVTGQCIDMPNEPQDSDFKSKVKATAYPCRERGGIIWTYMGPRAVPPELPHLEANMLPEGAYMVSANFTECNWLQRLEGDFDTSHVGFLHSGHVEPDEVEYGTNMYWCLRDRAPKYSVVDMPAGMMYCGYRNAEPGQIYYRIAQLLMPSFLLLAPGTLGASIGSQVTVPMDDTHCLRFIMNSVDRRPELAGVGNANYTREQHLPNSTDWFGRFRTVENAANDYNIDRDRQRRKEQFTGIQGINLQDRMICESEGPIYDRTTERLGSSDTAVIRLRRRLFAAASALAEHGTPPPGVDNPDGYAQRSGGVYLPEGVDWVAATQELRKAFVEHEGLNLTMEGAVPEVRRT